MKVSLFSDAYDEVPKAWDGSWSEFCAALSTHDYSKTDKLKCPAFSPVEFVKGTTSRLNKLVVAVHMFVLDVDHATETAVLGLCSTLEELGLAALVYTTWRHAEDPWRVRIVIPFSRPVPGSRWEDFWVKLNAVFDGLCDPKCRNSARIYFGPFAPAGTEESNWIHVFEGVELDVDAIAEVEVPIPPPAALIPLSRERFERWAKLCAKKKSDEYRAELGELLIKIGKGEAFAEPGERDVVIFKLSCLLMGRFSECTPESIAEFFRPSLALMSKMAPDCPDVEAVLYKLRRAQEAIQEEEQKKKEEEDVRVREAFRNGRNDPYTLEEIRGFGPIIHKRWIIQRGKSFYFFVNGRYVGPYTDSDMQGAASRELAPAKTAGVELVRVTRDGSTMLKGITNLVQQYGTVAQKTVVDLRAQKTRYEEETLSIIEAPCPMRQLTPTFHEEINRWLEIMAGEKQDLLKTWLAAVTLLDEPCVALFVTGPKGTGKSLLALGTSRIWTMTRPTPLEEVFSDFNDSLIYCPLCFADEQLPRDYRGFAKNSELRHHIQATRRPYKRKFHPIADMIGATRTIIAANNVNVLRTAESLSSHDIEAIMERYLWIPTQEEAAEYLNDVDTSEWVRGDKIAEHVLWLTQHHKWKPDGRFLIQVKDESLHRALATQTGVRSVICQWLTGYLLNPSKFDKDARSNSMVRVKDKKLLVNVQGLISCWDHYVTNEKVPATGPLASELAALCVTNGKKDSRLKYHAKNGMRVHYREFNTENLVAWAEANHFADREQLLEALSKDTQELTLN